MISNLVRIIPPNMKFINEDNFWYLSEGLTYNANDLSVLDGLLEGFNSRTCLIDRIIQGNRSHGFQSKVELDTNQLIFHLDKYLTAEKNDLTTAVLTQDKRENSLPPCVHLNTHSPSLDVPQRVEIPLKYILKGLPSLNGTHMVYLHAIQVNDGPTFSYYGKTKRGWMKRYIEHVKLAMKGSNRKFPYLFGKAIKARYDQLYLGMPAIGVPVYSGSYHVVCSAGLNKAAANEIERYLIKKYGLDASKGLNMI